MGNCEFMEILKNVLNVLIFRPKVSLEMSGQCSGVHWRFDWQPELRVKILALVTKFNASALRPILSR